MNRTILMLEHDDDDRYITQSFFDEKKINVRLAFASNSIELMKYLQDCLVKKSPLPSLILLNFNALPMNAVEILKEIKSKSAFALIPVVVLSGTVRKEIVEACYRAGASSFIQKPSSAKDTETKISNFVHYWLETVELV